MSLVTGKRLSRHQWTKIPMTNAVISAVKAMAEKEGQPLIKGGVPLFELRPNASVEDFLEKDVESADEYENFTEDNFDPTEPDNDVVEEPDDYNDIEPFDDDDVGVPDDDGVGAPYDHEVDDPAGFEPDPDDFGPDELDPDADEGAEANDDPGDKDPGGDAPNTNMEPDANEDLGTNRYNLRSDRGRSYGHRLDHQMDDPVSSKSYESGVQMLEQAAGKMDESLDNIYKYIFGQRSSKLKGRTCADGRSQRFKYTKEETTSPTVSTDALMISLKINAKEQRDVAMADVEGAYLHADVEDFVLLKLVGEAVDIICQVNPKYEKFVVIENGKKVLYLQLLKALYGCVQSALLWYNLFTNTLVRMGFKLNPYDLCVTNSQIKGKQCTVAWYVDENKISHVDDTVVTDIIEKIEAKVGKMTVTRGKHHVFFGMDITFINNDGTVTILMKEYLKEAIANSGMDASKVAPTPAKKDLFTIDDGSEQLDKRQGEIFTALSQNYLELVPTLN